MPVYKYAKPTEKPQFGKPPALGYKIKEYKLPVTDTQTERRNFPGYGESTYFTLADMQQGDTSGTTETDSATGKSEGGYTKINQKKGKVR